MTSAGAIIITEGQFTLLKRLGELPRVSEAAESPLGSFIFWKNKAPPIFIAILLNESVSDVTSRASYTGYPNAVGFLQFNPKEQGSLLEIAGKAEGVDSDDFLENLTSRIYDYREDKTAASRFERWCLRANELPLRYISRNHPENRYDDESLRVDFTKMQDLDYCNELLVSMRRALE